MAVAPTTAKPKNGAASQAAPLQLSPELETFAVVKLGRPASLWRWLNRVITWANGEVSRDEWDQAFTLARQSIDGHALVPEDAARRAEALISARLDMTGLNRVHAAVAKCEASDTAILVAFMGRPSAAFFHSRAITLKDPGKRRG